jgi:hypothetical protein
MSSGRRATQLVNNSVDDLYYEPIVVGFCHHADQRLRT